MFRDPRISNDDFEALRGLVTMSPGCREMTDLPTVLGAVSPEAEEVARMVWEGDKDSPLFPEYRPILDGLYSSTVPMWLEGEPNPGTWQERLYREFGLSD